MIDTIQSTIQFTIQFNDLNDRKQEEMLTAVKAKIKEELEEEAKEKGKDLKKLLWEEYGMDYYCSEKEKEEFFAVSLDDFLEEKAKERILSRASFPARVELPL